MPATLHTDSAPESIVRLLDMGMDPFDIADALLGVLAQRPARRRCSNCKSAHVATRSELEDLMDEYSLELRATETGKKDLDSAKDAQFPVWTGRFGSDKGEITFEKVPMGITDIRQVRPVCIK